MSTKNFLWCGQELCEERDSTGGTTNKRFFKQGQINYQPSAINLFYTRDHLGSIREMTDLSQTIRARYDYDPYGRRVNVSGDLDSDFLFTGHYYHTVSGLYLTLYRAYDAETGRWLSRDPIGELAGLDLYAYVANNPINRIDPYGEDAVTVGPVTFPIPFTTEWWEAAAQSAHEGQHRADWLKGIPGWKKEQRGFQAEIPVWNKRIKDIEDHIAFLKANRCKLRGADRAIQYYEGLLPQMRSALTMAEMFAQSDEAAMDYWNNVARRWYQSPVSPPRPLPLGYVPPPSNLNRNAPPPLRLS